MNGRRFESEKEEREDGEGDEERQAGIMFNIDQLFVVGQNLEEEEQQARRRYCLDR